MNALALIIPHDKRDLAHNPPPVIAPAIDQAQFDYDAQREVEASLITNPVVMAHMIIELRDRIKALEGKIT